MNREIAIIIPAYKSRFLARTLASVAGQTSNEFKVYVFDDHSPNPVESITRAALSGGEANWSYERFAANLGGTGLTKHYDRCVKNTREPWVWLFADDDVMEAGCVASFLKTLRETDGRHDVYSFDSVEIDAEDRVMGLYPSIPAWESWKQYAYFLFRGNRVVPQQAVVFSRTAFEKLGAFVEFPLGWASDQATVMALAGERGIRHIPGAKVRFRNSGENISSVENTAITSQKLEATMQFMSWVVRRFNEVPDPSFPMSDESLRYHAFGWFKRQLASPHSWYGPGDCLRTARFIRDTWREPYLKSLARMFLLDFDSILTRARIRLSGSRSLKRF